MTKVIKMPEHESANCRMVLVFGKAYNNSNDEFETVSSIELWSYSTHVATWYKVGFCGDDGIQHYSDTIEVFWGWSATTARHLLWFRRYIGKRFYRSKWGDCWKGDCRKEKLLEASVYNPIRLTLTGYDM